MTETELAELDRMEKAATPGPWKCKWFEGLTPKSHVQPEMTMLDWDMVCKARNALPKLIEEIRRLRALAAYANNEFAKILVEVKDIRKIIVGDAPCNPSP